MNYNFKVMKIDEDYHIKMRIMKDLLEKNFNKIDWKVMP